MSDEHDRGWRVFGLFMLAGRWGSLSLVDDGVGWRFLARLGGEDHKTYLSHERFEDLPAAKVATDIHAQAEGLRGMWTLVAGLQRTRQVGEQGWSAQIFQAPEGWLVAHVATLAWGSLERVLAQHSHSDVRDFDDFDAAMAFAESWHPPEVQTLCPCIGVMP